MNRQQDAHTNVHGPARPAPSAAPAGQAVRLESGGDQPTLSVQTPDGRWVRLHSARKPVEEADRLLAPAFAAGAPDLVIVIGLGLGYVLDAIEARSASTRVIALEPIPGAQVHCAQRRDWQAWTQTGRLALLTGPGYAGGSGAWRLIDGTSGHPPTIVNPVLAREFPLDVAAAQRSAEQILTGAAANAEARRRFAGPYLLNTLSNLAVIAREGDAGALADRFVGMPAIVAAAGPSLDRNINQLRPLADRAVLVACDTALKPLLGAGLPPDFVVGVDPQESNARHLRDLPPCPDTCLVGEGSLHPSAFEAFRHRTFVFQVSNHHPWPWLQERGLGRARLRAWGSVLVTAVDLALRMGCDPIVFVGADLAYTDGQPYCRGTSFEQDWAGAVAWGSALPDLWRAAVESRRPTPVIDLAGLPNGTTATMDAFRHWIAEESAAVPGRRFINATGRGTLTGGRLVQSTLEEALGGAPIVRPAVRARLTEIRAARNPSTPTRAGEGPIVVDAAVVELWRQFAAGTISHEQITAALDAARAADQRPQPLPGRIVGLPGHTLASLAHPTPMRPRRALPLSVRPPERLAAVRALRVNADMPDWTTTDAANPVVPGEAPFLRALVLTATNALCRLLAQPEPAARLLPGYEQIGGPAPDTLPLTAAFDWSIDARPDVDVLERCARLACGFAPAAASRSALETFRWTVARSAQPRPSPEASDALPTSADAIAWWAKRALVIEWASLFTAIPEAGADRRADITAHFAEWLRDLADGPFPVGLGQPSVTLEVHLTGADGAESTATFDLRTPPMRVMRGLTGAVVRARSGDDPGGADEQQPARPALLDADLGDPAGGPARIRCLLVPTSAAPAAAVDPRTRFFGRRDGWLRPKALALPGSFIAGTVDGSTALVTPYAERASWAIDARGTLTRLAEWPYPIIGEQHGPTGWAVAWSTVGSWYLMRRRSSDARAETVIAPFRPGRAVVLDDGTSLWSSTTGGLWRWAPDGQVTCEVATPAVGGIFADGDGVVLDPVCTDAALQQYRVLLHRGWRYGFTSRRLDERALGPFGQSCRRVVSGSGTATAYPAADVVTVDVGNGVRFDMACDWPNDLAWAGDALVVVGAYGTVLLFERLSRELERA